jgi:hypothetical protein
MAPRENKAGYASSAQRDVLVDLVSLPAISDHFFLTGGTALSVFYLHHRQSNDLDLFAADTQDVGQIGFQIKRTWPGEIVLINQSSHFLSLLFRDVKVDLVIDTLSTKEKRPRFTLQNGNSLLIDTLTNIASNKFCTLVSRTEPKDYVDFFFIAKMVFGFDRDAAYEGAALKDAVFDDPPTAAFQIESGLDFMKRNPDLFPQMMVDFDHGECFEFFKELAKWIYGRAVPND